MGWVGLGHGSEMADLRKTDVVYITTYVCNFALGSNSIVLLCENLQFGASLHLRSMGVGLDMAWVGSRVHKFTWQWVGLGLGR